MTKKRPPCKTGPAGMASARHGDRGADPARIRIARRGQHRTSGSRAAAHQNAALPGGAGIAESGLPAGSLVTISRQQPGSFNGRLLRVPVERYNAAMTSRAKQRRGAERRLTEQRVTERRNPASRNLDRMTAMEIVRLMNREDRKVAMAAGRELPAIARAVDAIVAGMRKGGRLIYVGAGTSGRMAVLDAAECAPTFGVSPGRVQALIAGGRRAVTGAVEGAEDSAANGERELRAKKLTGNDAIVGITASGTTPYVLGAMSYARKRGAVTVAITSNPHMPVARLARIVIALEAGPEILTGSTRLKAGTSQKMVLNMLSTAAMVRLGHAYENLMIDMALTNQKLANRAERMLAEASGAEMAAAKHALRQAGHSLRVALVMLKRGLDPGEAKQRLHAERGVLRKALGE
jgi:N-acetylmuramic acid 6-phosphate etherase